MSSKPTKVVGLEGAGREGRGGGKEEGVYPEILTIRTYLHKESIQVGREIGKMGYHKDKNE